MFSESPIGVNLVGLFFREVEVKSKTSKPDTEDHGRRKKGDIRDSAAAAEVSLGRRFPLDLATPCSVRRCRRLLPTRAAVAFLKRCTGCALAVKRGRRRDYESGKIFLLAGFDQKHQHPDGAHDRSHRYKRRPKIAPPLPTPLHLDFL